MLSDYISQSAISEIGASVSEVFGVPLVITDIDGNVLFLSANWANKKDLQAPDYIMHLLHRFQMTDKPVIRGPNNEQLAVIPIRFEDIACAFGIIDCAAAGPLDESSAAKIVEPIRKALGDISIYASWALHKQFNDVRSEASRVTLEFRNGAITQENVLKTFLANIISLDFIDLAMIALAEEQQGVFRPEYIAGDRSLLPDCIRQCGLSWWSVYEKKPVIIRHPQDDARCKKEDPKGQVNTVAVWPLFMKDRLFGVLYLSSRLDKMFEPWQQDYINNVAVSISFILNIGARERENSAFLRKINALNEISRVLSSSLNLSTVLNLVADMAANLFDTDICCVYLKDRYSSELNLMVARGVQPAEAELLRNRFKLKEAGAEEENGLLDFPIPAKSGEIGCLSLGGFHNGVLSQEDRELVKTFACMAGIAVENSRMFEDTQKTLLETITVLGLAIEARDKNTFGHSEKVRELAVALAEGISLSAEEVAYIESASILHDIGKLGISEAILNKQGSLTAQEYEEFKNHPVIGADILRTVSAFGPITSLVRHHHERHNGSGYPDGLKGAEIPLGSRILAIADTFAALTSKRSYRSAKEPFEALKVIKANSGTHFDPDLIDAFEKVIRKRYSLRVDLGEEASTVEGSSPTLVSEELGLTEREAEILCYIAIGMSNKEIAAALFLSEKTVKTHVTHILKKLNLTDRTKAAVFAIQKGMTKVVRVNKTEGYLTE